jgi:hypothetical protein
MKRLFLAATAAALLGFAGQANATQQLAVNVTDDIYGNFAGAISVPGPDFILDWHSAGWGATGDIDLTDGSGTVLDHIALFASDEFLLTGPEVLIDPVIGSTCVADASTVCVALTPHVPTSLYNAVNTLNGGQGICCGSSDIVVTLGSAVPEPGAWAIVTLGFGAIGFGLRRRRVATLAV